MGTHAQLASSSLALAEAPRVSIRMRWPPVQKT